MKDIKFKTKVTKIGKLSEGLIENNYLILFDEENPDFANEFGFSVKHSPLINPIEIGDIAIIGNQEFKILDISEGTNEGLKSESHLSFHINRDFDGSKQILLEGEKFPQVNENTIIEIRKRLSN